MAVPTANRTDGEQPGHMIDQRARSFVSAPVLVFREYRHERLGKRPLGEQTTQQVGNPESDKEGVRHEAGAEDPGDNRVADETQHPRDERHAAHRRQHAEEIHLACAAQAGPSCQSAWMSV